MDFYYKQLQNEKKYIENKYLSSLTRYDFKDVKIEGDFVVKKVILNETPYKMYVKKAKDFEILFVPETLINNINFINDFDDIIKYKKTDKEIHFSLISKKENYINLFNYDFYANESGYSSGNYFSDGFNDNNSIIQFEFLKNNISIPDFFYNLNIRKLTNCGYRLNRIKRNQEETKLNKINKISILEAYGVYDSRFKQIQDNDSPILEILENISKEKQMKARI